MLYILVGATVGGIAAFCVGKIIIMLFALIFGFVISCDFSIVNRTTAHEFGKYAIYGIIIGTHSGFVLTLLLLFILL